MRATVWRKQVIFFGFMVTLGCGKAGLPAAPQPLSGPQITAAVDHTTVAPGDPLTLTVTLKHGKNVDITLVDPGQSLGGLPLVEHTQEAPRESEDRVREVHTFKLRAQAIGSYILPPFVAKKADGSSIESNSVFVEVTGETVAPELRDIKPIKDVRYAARWPFIVMGVAALACFAAAVWWWRRKRKRAHPAPPPLPHEAAFAALATLKQTNFSDLRAVRRFYFAVSEVLRVYVEARFALNATDLTTEEILARLPQLAELQPNERDRLKDFLSDTDRVKYASYAPSSQEIGASFERALRFVEATAHRVDVSIASPKA